MPTTSFKQLDVWQKARLVTLAVYRATTAFPKHQLFSLTAQMQRAALSIGANIAEGYGRRSPRDKAHFYTIAMGSADELEHYLAIAQDLAYWNGDLSLAQLLQDVGKMLRRLIQKTLTGF